MHWRLSLGVHTVVYAGTLLLFSPTGLWVWTLCLGALLLWGSVVDFDRFELPDFGALGLAVLGAVRLLVDPGVLVLDHLLGLVLWPALFWLVAIQYLRWRGANGLGFGDVKLMAGIGICLGFSATTYVVMAASVSAMLTLAAFALLHRSTNDQFRQRAIAFGPFLCFSTWVVWLFGVQGD